MNTAAAVTRLESLGRSVAAIMYAVENRPGEADMSILSFAEEFSRLILRYTKNTPINVKYPRLDRAARAISAIGFHAEIDRFLSRVSIRVFQTDQSKDVSKPLTHEEIASTISNVLSALGLTSTDLKNLDSSVDSSVNTTVLSTPAVSLSPIRRKQDDRARRFFRNFLFSFFFFFFF